MRIRALIVRIIRQFMHDKRTLALLIVAPLLVLSMLYLVFNGDTYQPKIGTVHLPQTITDSFSEQDVSITRYESIAQAEAALQARAIDAYITLNSAQPYVKLEGSNPTQSKAALMLIQKMLQERANQAALAAPAPVFEYLHGGEHMSTFDSISPALIGLFAFFFVFLISGISFLKERTSGTLERLLATPLRRSEIVIGYVGGFGIFTSLQAILIASYTIGVLGTMMVGSIWLVLLIMLLLSLTALSFGTFLSAYAETEFQMIQFIPIVIVPQVFFSGLFDLESISPWLRWLNHITPLKYGADALTSVMIRGEGWSAIAVDVYVLIGLTIVFMAANVFALRKHRKL